MNKSQQIRTATRKTRGKNTKKRIAKIISWPCRAFRALWNWLKSIDIIGMVNLTLLVVIIVLFSALVADYIRYDKNASSVKVANRVDTVATVKKQPTSNDNRKVANRNFPTTLPVKADKKTNINPKIRTVGVAKPQIIKELSLPAEELPEQTLSGDVIVDNYPSSPVLSNGVKINGNLFIQNMRKYTIPCDAKINGHLFIRNVAHLNFCGKFKVNGNVYVNRGSAFGAIPEDAKINGQIIL